MKACHNVASLLGDNLCNQGYMEINYLIFLYRGIWLVFVLIYKWSLIDIVLLISGEGSLNINTCY